MEVRTIHYPLWHTSVQISAFIPRQGVAEYMAMVIPEPGVGDFAVQLEHIRSTIEYLLTECVKQRKKNGKYVSDTIDEPIELDIK
mgnify:CR=1 FL=1